MKLYVLLPLEKASGSFRQPTWQEIINTFVETIGGRIVTLVRIVGFDDVYWRDSGIGKGPVAAAGPELPGLIRRLCVSDNLN
ncbi:hypothetical protein CEJ86_30775 [Sinorhizobium meliloti]|uniref:Uncharacterized protein n=1 Tax=Rhizobium meliloti TaxID=382 RepID=A0A2J0YTS3_RHIML|nr:hypothetical protein CEJ86_30775 [Sinorhizobium meliloti]